ncbi:MAG: hypothetical protein HYX92_11390 [Chloroflexi bacterium]|nr:hypothetical protein [Chloroflexota bacterium]
MEGKWDHLLPEPIQVKELVHHDVARAEKELGPSFRTIDETLMPGADMTVGVRRIDRVPKDFKPVVDPHKHDVSSVYMFMGDLRVEVTLDGETYLVSAPASAFVPARVEHSYRPLSGAGYVVVITRQGKYE